MARGREDDAERAVDADVDIGASMRADSLRFRGRPQTEVEVHGEVVEGDRRDDLETTSGSERENLPDEVEPGVTYRDVSVRWRAAGRIPDEPQRPEGDTRERRRKR